jgi:hypothetical protein
MAKSIQAKDYDSQLHSNWKKFGDNFYATKKDLLQSLSEKRLFPDAPTKETHPELFDKSDNISHYIGNPNIKAAHQNLEYTPEQLREYKKCMEDPIYFAETYMKIMSVDYGEIPFTLYDFQRDMINDFKNDRFNICKLPRQCGKSTTSVAFILWFALFNPGKTIGILANKGELAQEILGRLQLAYENLPFWLQQGAVSFNKRSVTLENGSKIIATSSSGSAARGMSFSLIFLDEFAFVPANDAEDFFRSVYPTISSGADTKMIVVSTPKGMNHFYKMWTEAEKGKSAFNPISINWWDVPGRDEDWKQEQIANTSEDQFRQEFECQFIGSANTLISPTTLSAIPFIDPIKQYEGVDYHEEVIQGHNYLICVDTARGIRLDYSAFVVVDITTIPYKVVAKYRSNDISPMIFPQFVSNIGKYYNNAWVLVESNDMGGQVINSLVFELEYENMLKTVAKGRAGNQLGGGPNSKFGVTMSHSVKTNGCSNLKTLIENDKFTVNDYDIYVELTTFVRKGNSSNSSFAAEAGTNDDLVMCLVMFGWASGTEYWKELTESDPAKLMYQERAERKEEEGMPIGFLNQDNTYPTQDQSGDLWTPIAIDDRPEWFDDVYKNWDADWDSKF